MALEPKQVTEIGKDILKSDASPAFLNASLKKLKDGLVPSEELLRQTRIGVAVAKLKQHPDSEIARQAASLVSSWRAVIKSKEKKGGPQANGAGTPSRSSTPNISTPKAAGARSPLPPQNAKTDPNSLATPKKTKVPPEKRNAESDDVNVNKTGDKVRDGCLKLMYNGLAFMSEEPSAHILPIATHIEVCAWAYYPPDPKSNDASQPYRNKMRSLFQNLKGKTSAGLRADVLSGKIPPERFVRLTDEELQSPERRAEIAALEKENDHDSALPQEEKSITNAFTCGKCKQNKVSYTQAQTRSADEPMTTFCKCENCGNRWKFS